MDARQTSNGKVIIAVTIINAYASHTPLEAPPSLQKTLMLFMNSFEEHNCYLFEQDL